MEKTENKYQRGKIYKIISNQTNDVYYGSTIEPYLTNRLSKHRQSYKSWLNGKYCYTTSFEIVKFEDAKIILVEDFSCNTKDHLLAREQYYIDNNDCVNKRNSLRTESRSVYNKEYRKENKEKILKYLKQYREENKEKISQYKKQYYEKNKTKINEQCDCVCGSIVLKIDIRRHERSKHHQEFIENQKLMQRSESQ